MTIKAMTTVNHRFAPRWTGMDLDLLARVRTSASIFGIVMAVPFATYFGISNGAAWVCGIAWSLVNLHFITSLTKQVITTGDRHVLKLVLTLFLKFPVLYGVGFFLLAGLRLPVIWLVAGFTWPFFVLTLKGMGRAWLRLDEQGETRSHDTPGAEG